MLLDLVALARPRQWLKNAFVFMPVPFALATGAALDAVGFVTGLVGFCLVTSAVYAFNDVVDAERDRAHAGKRDRPVASGRVPPAVARGWSALLLVAGTGLVALTGVPRALLIVAAYVLLNVAYSLRARHVPLLDVFLLSAGFVLRVLLGCALVAAPPSNWLLLCSWSLALFLALAKRRGDIVGGVDDAHRPSLAGYSEGFLDQAIGITTAMTLIAYALYCMDADALRPGREFATLPFVVFGVLEYLRRVRVRGEGASPEDLLLSSPALLLCATGWVAAVLWSVALP